MLSKLIWGQLRERSAMTALHIGLIAVGTAALLLVTTLLQTITENAGRDAKNIDLVVGAKGSPVQLVLSGVFHIDAPAGNISMRSLETTVARHPLIAQVIPLSLGDSYAGARIVGTTPALIEHYGASFAEGALWATPMDVVIGAEVAQRTGLQVGMTFEGSHGLDAQGGAHGDHPMMVTGILKPTKSVVDRLILTSVESVWSAHGLENNPEKNETTMAIVRYKSALAAASVPRLINATTDLQAASPALESARLLTIFGWIATILRAFAVLVVVVAGVSLFAALTHVLNHRMFDIAVVRALGARRMDVFRLLTFETLIVGAVGVCVGLLLSRIAAMTMNRWLPAQAALPVGAPTLVELFVLLSVIIFALLCTLYPAWRAYRADAASLLSQGRV